MDGQIERNATGLEGEQDDSSLKPEIRCLTTVYYFLFWVSNRVFTLSAGSSTPDIQASCGASSTCKTAAAGRNPNAAQPNCASNLTCCTMTARLAKARPEGRRDHAAARNKKAASPLFCPLARASGRTFDTFFRFTAQTAQPLPAARKMHAHRRTRPFGVAPRDGVENALMFHVDPRHISDGIALGQTR
jgi:hypothetical protein